MHTLLCVHHAENVNTSCLLYLVFYEGELISVESFTDSFYYIYICFIPDIPQKVLRDNPAY